MAICLVVINQLLPKRSTTISAIEQLLELMVPEGIIVLVIYHGHPEGEMKRDELLDYVKNIPQNKHMYFIMDL